MCGCICGTALKIHVSLQCKQLLDKLGGYQTENRGLIYVKVSHYVMACLLGYNRYEYFLYFLQCFSQEGKQLILMNCMYMYNLANYLSQWEPGM